MATYTKVSNSIPSSQRAALITAVSAGDQIDLRDVLGRKARKVIFNMTDAADTITFKVNHLRRLRSKAEGVPDGLSRAFQLWGTYGTDEILVWSGTGSTFTGTGSTQLESAEGLDIDSLEIVSLSLSSGTTITISAT
jgi:hypothetical protein